MCLDWAKKWEKTDQIGEDVFKFACLSNAKPDNITGLIQSHKEGCPLRVVTTGCSTAIRSLSAFTEYYLSPLARQHQAYIKDTTHLLTKLQKFREERVFPPGTLLVTWNVEAMFPNIDTKFRLEGSSQSP